MDRLPESAHDLYVAELIIKTPSGTVGEPDRWVAFVARELQTPDGFVIVDDGKRGSYAQAANERGTLILEFRDGSRRRHYQARDIGLDDIAEALSQWARGRRDFIQRHAWTRLQLWDDRPAAPHSSAEEQPAQPPA